MAVKEFLVLHRSDFTVRVGQDGDRYQVVQSARWIQGLANNYYLEPEYHDFYVDAVHRAHRILDSTHSLWISPTANALPNEDSLELLDLRTVEP